MDSVRSVTRLASLVLASLVFEVLTAVPSDATVIWREVVDASISGWVLAESQKGKEFFSDSDEASQEFPPDPLPLHIAISAHVPHADASAHGSVQRDRVQISKNAYPDLPEGLWAYARIEGTLHRRFEVSGPGLVEVTIPLRVTGGLVGDSPYAEWRAGVVGVSMLSGLHACFLCAVDTTFTWTGALAPGSYVFEMGVRGPDYEAAGESAYLVNYTIKLDYPRAGRGLAGLLGPTLVSAPYPNPASESCTLSLLASQDGPAEVRVIDVRGRAVRSLMDATVTSGRHELEWDLTDDDGNRVAPGVYVIIINDDADTAQRIVVAR
jgi:hypothetical protein